jgi:hypothetical protein
MGTGLIGSVGIASVTLCTSKYFDRVRMIEAAHAAVALHALIGFGGSWKGMGTLKQQRQPSDNQCDDQYHRPETPSTHTARLTAVYPISQSNSATLIHPLRFING